MAQRDKLSQDGRAFTVINKKAHNSLLNEEYELIAFDEPSKITDTSYLVVGQLRPKTNKALVTFVLRWDEKASSLDIDPQSEKPIDPKLLARFRSDKDKIYYGHHPIKQADGWSFDTNIGWNGTPIFKGIIQFNLGRQAGISDGAKMGDHVEIEVFRNGVKIDA